MNLMELFVKIDVDDQASKNISRISSKLGGGLKTAANIGVKAITAASTAIIGLTGLAIKNYAEYEQLVGGVETLFGDSADRLMGYAEKAYMTAGMSANQYMSIATSFSASLLQSLKGDTKAAADYADMAMQDMADNANKMGTNIDLIQQTYQSLARGNFAMLDNLKLGYGGTRAEMERLIADAAKLDDSVKANDMSFGNLVKAIHVVQDEMGITGTTMKEASETITGSLMMTKAAWSNLITGIADDNADFDKLIDNFVESAGIAAGNLLPRVEVALVGVGKLIEELFPIIMDRIPKIISNTIPKILSSAGQIMISLANGIIDALPVLAETALDILPTLINGITKTLPKMLSRFADVALEVITMLSQGISEMLPNLVPAVADIILHIVKILTQPETLSTLFDAALAIIIALAEGLIKSIPTLLQAAVQLVAGIVRGIGSALGSIVKAGNNLVTRFADGINDKISTAVTKAKNLASRVVSAVRSGIKNIASVGASLVEGLWNGVSNKIGWITRKMASFGKQVIKSLKNFFGIHSPSTVMRDEIGRFLAEGVAVGFMENDPIAEIETSLNNGIRRIDTPSLGVYGGGGYSGSEVSIIQNIYSQAQTAADLMQEAIYQQEKAVYLGV